MSKISKIKAEIDNCDIKILNELLVEYRADERAGVQKLISAAERKIEKYELELKRIEQMKEFEYKYSDYAYMRY